MSEGRGTLDIAGHGCAALAIAILMIAGPAQAQTTLMVLVGQPGRPLNEQRAQGDRLASSLGPDVSWGEAAARAINERFAFVHSTEDTLTRERALLAEARTAWSAATARGDARGQAAALNAIDAAVRAMEGAGEAIDLPQNQVAIRENLIFLAERYLPDEPTRMEDAIRRLARLDPSIVFAARDASPEVQQMYVRTVAATPRGALAVQSIPEGCTVVRDGRTVGNAPAELRDLTPGLHRLSVRCSAENSRIHPITVAPNTTTTLVIDVTLDAALVSERYPALVYASPEQAPQRLTNDLTALGRSVGARRVLGVSGVDGHVWVVDAVRGADVGETTTSDVARVRALLREAVGATPRPMGDHGSDRVSPGAVVLFTLGALALGGGVVAHQQADGLSNRSAQNGELPGDTGRTMHANADQSQILRYTEVSCFVGGGVLLVAGALVTAFAGSHSPTRSFRATVTPAADGISFGIAGAF